MQPFRAIKEFFAGLKETFQLLKKVSEQQTQEIRTGLRAEFGPAVRKLTQMILEDRGRSLQVTFVLPDDMPRSLGDASRRMQAQARLASAIEQIQNLGTVDMNAVTTDVEKQMSATLSSEVTVSLTLGGREARWHYTSHPTFVSRVPAETWPDVLFALKKQWPGARPRLDSVTVLKMRGLLVKSASSAPDLKNPLLPAAVEAIAEVFAVEPDQSATAT